MTIEYLTPQQLQTYNDEGILCIPNFLSPEEVKLLMKTSRQLLEDFDTQGTPKSQFKTGEDGHIGDQYFFDSSDKVSYFYDVDAFDEMGNLKYPKDKVVNKIGHAVHEQNPAFRNITFDERVQSIAKSLNFKDPRVLQSMVIFKHPVDDKDQERINLVPPHTDGTFLFTDPQTAVGFWFALEDCTVENGCLYYSPGTHKTHDITQRFVKVNGGDDGCGFVPIPGSTEKDISDLEYKKVECKAGSLVLIHNSVLHKSENNRSNKSRFAYTFHVIDGKANYDKLNWLQVPPGKEGGTDFSKLYG